MELIPDGAQMFRSDVDAPKEALGHQQDGVTTSTVKNAGTPWIRWRLNSSNGINGLIGGLSCIKAMLLIKDTICSHRQKHYCTNK